LHYVINRVGTVVKLIKRTRRFLDSGIPKFILSLCLQANISSSLC
jgi:hypothetical protein